jgi:hypothetical protein
MSRGIARGLGLVVTMLGLGLRLDSSWQILGVSLLGAGCVVGGWGLLRGAFVHGDGGE